jgi:hypothetical protein
VAALSATDAWAVGYIGTSNPAQTLIEHWDGTAWSRVSSPSPDPTGKNLTSVSAVSPNDIWAVGYRGVAGGGTSQTLILHWDGSTWTVVSSPNPGAGNGNNSLYAVAARAANDVWAVGYYSTTFGGVNQTLIVHWDGTAWNVVPSPNPNNNGRLYGVALAGATEVWAVGYYGGTGTPTDQTLTEHWNGTAWTVVSSPNPGQNGNGFNRLFAVAAVGAGDVWAVGQYSSGDPSHALTLHWDGTAWAVIANGASYSLEAIAARAGDDVWAVGWGPNQTLSAHWNGTAWSVVFTPWYGSATLSGVAISTASEVWATLRDGGVNTAFEHYSDPCAPPPSPTVTTTPTDRATPTPLCCTATRTATPTDTATPTPLCCTVTPTDSPTATSTPCLLLFTDVPPGSTFYDFVRCLACRGVLSGYPCGGPGEPCPGSYFRPATNLTRGQAAKIVSAAAGYEEPVPPDRQTFSDVPPAGTFWVWVERIASRAIISGYPCGGPGEGCDPLQRPYFRPNNNVTRGQLAKIVAGGANMQDPVPSTQWTFQDVPPGATFWTWIERLTSRQIIGGYPCGGPGEPCVAPLDRPYYRANNAVTRGQAAKIVANSFWPGCETPRRP